MSISIRLFAGLSLVCLTAVNTCYAAPSPFKIRRLHHTTIVYQGRIVAEKSLEAIKNAASKATTTLVITSQGGDLLEGVKIGNFLADHQIDVEVKDYCLSSCANNVFLAGHRKTLHPGAILGFHGSMGRPIAADSDIKRDRDTNDATPNQLLEKLAALADQEGLLLRRLNLNPDILIEMMRRLEKVLPPNKVKLILTLNGREYVLEDDQNPDEALRAVIEKELKRGELKKITLSRENPYGDAVYFPSQKTLEQYGVSGIVTYAYPVDQNALKKLYEGRAHRWKLVPIRIAGDFEQTDRQE